MPFDDIDFSKVGRPKHRRRALRERPAPQIQKRVDPNMQTGPDDEDLTDKDAGIYGNKRLYTNPPPYQGPPSLKLLENISVTPATDATRVRPSVRRANPDLMTNQDAVVHLAHAPKQPTNSDGENDFDFSNVGRPSPKPTPLRPGVNRFAGSGVWSLDRLSDIEKAFRERTGRNLPVSVRGQGNIHNRWGWDHGNAADIGLNPNSRDGQTLTQYLTEANIPFSAFDHAIPGVATGPHIHIGRPSHRLGANGPTPPPHSTPGIDFSNIGRSQEGAPLPTVQPKAIDLTTVGKPSMLPRVNPTLADSPAIRDGRYGDNTVFENGKWVYHPEMPFDKTQPAETPQNTPAVNPTVPIQPAEQTTSTPSNPSRVSADETRRRNARYTKPGMKLTELSSQDEARFQEWATQNKAPITTDYDMRGFWQALDRGEPIAKTAVNQNDQQIHYPDRWKTPEHKSFSNESMYATPDAPRWNDKDQLTDKDGRIVYDERAEQSSPALARPGFSETLAEMNKLYGGARSAKELGNRLRYINEAQGKVDLTNPKVRAGVATGNYKYTPPASAQRSQQSRHEQSGFSLPRDIQDNLTAHLDWHLGMTPADFMRQTSEQKQATLRGLTALVRIDDEKKKRGEAVERPTPDQTAYYRQQLKYKLRPEVNTSTDLEAKPAFDFSGRKPALEFGVPNIGTQMGRGQSTQRGEMERVAQSGIPIEQAVGAKASELRQQIDQRAQEIKQGMVAERARASQSIGIDPQRAQSSVYGMSDADMDALARDQAMTEVNERMGAQKHGADALASITAEERTYIAGGATDAEKQMRQRAVVARKEQSGKVNSKAMQEMEAAYALATPEMRAERLSAEVATRTKQLDNVTRETQRLVGMQGELGVSEKWRDIKKNPGQLVPYLSGLLEMNAAGNLLEASNRIQEGTADQLDLALLRHFSTLNSKDKSVWYEALDVISQAPSFIGEMVGTSGIYQGVKTSTLSFLKSLATKEGLGVLERQAGRSLADFTAKGIAKRKAIGLGTEAAASMIASIPQTAAASPFRIGAELNQNQLPEVEISRDETGLLHGVVTKQGDGFAEALKRALGSQYGEIFSEHAGGALEFIPIPKRLEAIKAGIIKRWLGAHPGGTVGAFARLVEKSSWHGPIGESFEERVANVWDYGRGEAKSPFPTLRQLAVEGIAFPAMGAVFSGAGAAYSRHLKKIALKDIQSAPDETSRVFIAAQAVNGGALTMEQADEALKKAYGTPTIPEEQQIALHVNAINTAQGEEQFTAAVQSAVAAGLDVPQHIIELANLPTEGGEGGDTNVTESQSTANLPLVENSSEGEAAGTPARAAASPRVVEHPNPVINNQPVIAETGDGKVVVANPANKSGVSVVKDRGRQGLVFQPPPGTPVAEATETVTEHFRSAADPASPRVGVLVTPGEQGPTTSKELRGFMSPIEVPEGSLYLSRAKVKKLGLTTVPAIQQYIAENGIAALIGKVDQVSDTSQGVALVTSTGDREDTSSIVISPESAEIQAAVDRKAHPSADNQELMGAQDAAAKRLDEREPWRMTRGQAVLATAKETFPIEGKVEIVNEKPVYAYSSRDVTITSRGPLNGTQIAERLHKKIVEKAFTEGKPVPAEVLADYPELKAKPIDFSKVGRSQKERRTGERTVEQRENWARGYLDDVGAKVKRVEGGGYTITDVDGKRTSVTDVDKLAAKAREISEKAAFYDPGEGKPATEKAKAKEKTLAPSGTEVATKENAGGVVSVEVGQSYRKSDGSIVEIRAVAPGGVMAGERGGEGKSKRVTNAILKSDYEKTEHKFSSTQVDLPPKMAAEVRALGEKLIPDSELYIDPNDDQYGRGNEIHVTVKYGLHTENASDVRKILEGESPVGITLGKVSIFAGKGETPYDVVKVEVESPDLHRLNELIANGTKVTDTFPTYKPHITLAYVKKGEGQKYVGDESLSGKKLTINDVTFSSSSGERVFIPLEVEKPATVAEATPKAERGDVAIPPEPKLTAAEQKTQDKINKAASRKPRARRSADPSKHHLIAYVALNGGIKPGTRRGPIDTDPIKETKYGIIPLVQKNGRDAEDMMRAAIDSGYLAGRMNTDQAQHGGDFDDYNANDFIQILADSHNAPLYSTENSAMMEIEGLGALEVGEAALITKHNDFLKDADAETIFKSIEETGEISETESEKLDKIGKRYGIPFKIIDATIDEVRHRAAARLGIENDPGASLADAEKYSRIFSEPAQEEIDESEPEGEVDTSFDFADKPTRKLADMGRAEQAGLGLNEAEGLFAEGGPSVTETIAPKITPADKEKQRKRLENRETERQHDLNVGAFGVEAAVQIERVARGDGQAAKAAQIVIDQRDKAGLLGDELATVVTEYDKIERAGSTIADYLAQDDMFGDKPTLTAGQELLLRFIEGGQFKAAVEKLVGMVTQEAGEGTLTFADKAQADVWIKTKAKEYGGKGKLQASDEYAAAYPEIKRVYAEDRKTQAAVNSRVIIEPKGKSFALRYENVPDGYVASGGGVFGGMAEFKDEAAAQSYADRHGLKVVSEEAAEKIEDIGETDKGVMLKMAEPEESESTELQHLREVEFADELTPQIISTRDGDLVNLNNEGQEILRRAFEQVKIDRGEGQGEEYPHESSFFGVFVEPADVRATVKVLTSGIRQMEALGYPNENIEPLRKLSQDLIDAAKAGKGTAVVAVDPESVSHESLHQGSFLGSGGKALWNRHRPTRMIELAYSQDGEGWASHYGNTPEYAQIVSLYRGAKDKAIAGLTADERDAIALIVEETAAVHANGDWNLLGRTEGDALTYLKQWFTSYTEKNGVQSLSEFQRQRDHVQKIITERQARLGVQAAEAEGSRQPNEGIRDNQGNAPPTTGSTRRGTPEAPPEPESEEGVDGQVDGESRSESERPAATGIPTDGTKRVREPRDDSSNRLRSLPGTLRSQDLLAADQLYEVYPNKVALEDGKNLLEALGWEPALALLKSNTAKGADHVAMAKIMMRGLLNEAFEVAPNDETLAAKLRQDELDIAEMLSEQMTTAGQFIQAAQILENSVEGVMMAGTRLARERGRQLSNGEARSLQQVGEEFELATADLQYTAGTVGERRDAVERATQWHADAKEGKLTMAEIDTLRKRLASLRGKERRSVERLKEIEGLIPPRMRPKRTQGARSRALVMLAINEDELTADLRASLGLGRGPLKSAIVTLDDGKQVTIAENQTELLNERIEADLEHLEDIQRVNPVNILTPQERALELIVRLRKVDADHKAKYRASLYGRGFIDNDKTSGYFKNSDKRVHYRDRINAEHKTEFQKALRALMPLIDTAGVPDEIVRSPWVNDRELLLRSRDSMERLVDWSMTVTIESSSQEVVRAFENLQRVSGLLEGRISVQSDSPQSGRVESLVEASELAHSPLKMAQAEGTITALSADQVNKLSRLGTSWLLQAERGTLSVEDFKERMRDEFGDIVTPNLDEIHAKSVETMRAALRADSHALKLESIAERPGNEDLSREELETILESDKAEQKRLNAVIREHDKAAKAFADRDIKAEREQERADEAANRVAKRASGREFRESQTFVKGVARKASNVFQRTVGGADVGSRILAQAIARNATNDLEAITAARLSLSMDRGKFAQEMKDEHGLEEKPMRDLFLRGAEVLKAARHEINESRLMAAALKDVVVETQDDLDRALASLQQKRSAHQSAQLRTANELENIKKGKLTTLGKRILSESKGVLISIMASGDMSDLFRQGGIAIAMRPTLFPQFAKANYRGLFDTKFAHDIDEIEQHPDFNLEQRIGIKFSHAGGGPGEEWFQNAQLLHTTPVIKQTLGKFVQKSDQVFGGGMDHIRHALAQLWIGELRAGGVTYKDNPKAYEDIAAFINIITGKGDIGEHNTKIVKALLYLGNLIGFAPRYRISRLQFLTLPIQPSFWRLNQPAQRIIFKNVARWYGTMGATFGILALLGWVAGATLTNLFNPDDDDWLKLKIGKGKFDLTAGNQVQLRTIVRLVLEGKRRATGEVTTSMAAKKMYEDMTRWFQSGLDPRTSLIVERFKDETYNHEKFTWFGDYFLDGAIGSRITPLIASQTAESGVKYGAGYAGMTFASEFLGVGGSTYPDREKPKTKGEYLANRFANQNEYTSNGDPLSWETKEQVDALKIRARAGEDVSAEVDQLVEDGLIKEAKGDTIINAKNQTYLEEKFRMLSFEKPARIEKVNGKQVVTYGTSDAEHIWKYLTSEEQVKVAEIYKTGMMKQQVKALKAAEKAREALADPEGAKLEAEKKKEKADKAAETRKRHLQEDFDRLTKPTAPVGLPKWNAPRASP